MGKCESYMQHGTMHLCYSMDRPSECKCGGDQNLCELPPEKSKKPKAAELKPCPFCGYVPTIEQFGAMFTLTNNHKPGCFIKSQNGYDNGKMTAFNWQCIEEAWNKRAENEELKFTRKFIHDHGLEFELASAWNRRADDGK